MLFQICRNLNIELNTLCNYNEWGLNVSSFRKGTLYSESSQNNLCFIQGYCSLLKLLHLLRLFIENVENYWKLLFTEMLPQE